MSWAWFALRPEAPTTAWASAAVRTAVGEPAGYLVAWERSHDRPEGASKIDARAVDPGGAPGWVSLVLPGDEETLPFDDPAVAGALRMVLALPPAPVFSTFSFGDDRWLGSLTGSTERDGRLDRDPFAHLARARVLQVDQGFLGTTPALPGPVVQRYGGDNPWSSGRFRPANS